MRKHLKVMEKKGSGLLNWKGSNTMKIFAKIPTPNSSESSLSIIVYRIK